MAIVIESGMSRFLLALVFVEAKSRDFLTSRGQTVCGQNFYTGGQKLYAIAARIAVRVKYAARHTHAVS
jgi:hypothetical protein